MTMQSRINAKRWMVAAVTLALVAAVGYFLVLPAYQVARVQSQVGEILVSIDRCREEVTKVVQTTQAPVLSTSLFGCDGGASSGVKISQHLKSIAVSSSGAINATLNVYTLPELSPTTRNLTVVPLTSDARVLTESDVRKTVSGWRCGNPQDGTTVPAKYLPVGCSG